MPVDTPAVGPDAEFLEKFMSESEVGGSVPGETALMTAAANGLTGAVYRLLKAGASVAAADRTKRTALHYAVTLHGREEVAAALLAAGADPWAEDDSGQTPAAMAINKTFTTGVPRESRLNEAQKMSLAIGAPLVHEADFTVHQPLLGQPSCCPPSVTFCHSCVDLKGGGSSLVPSWCRIRASRRSSTAGGGRRRSEQSGTRRFAERHLPQNSPHPRRLSSSFARSLPSAFPFLFGTPALWRFLRCMLNDCTPWMTGSPQIRESLRRHRWGAAGRSTRGGTTQHRQCPHPAPSARPLLTVRRGR